VLEDLRPAHPMIDKLLEWRIYTKLRSTYVDALPTLMASDGRLHTTFHQFQAIAFFTGSNIGWRYQWIIYIKNQVKPLGLQHATIAHGYLGERPVSTYCP